MDKIDVIWVSYHDDILNRGYWDQGLLEDVFKQFNVVHHDNFSGFANDKAATHEKTPGAVVIINGRTHTSEADIERLNSDIANLPWCLFIETGDEEALFPWRQVKHPLMRVWIMLPRMNQHDDVSFHLPNGYRPTTHEDLKTIGFQEKKLDWFFAGQVNHARREQCVHELKCLIDSGENPNGILVETDGFGKEAMSYATHYLSGMAQSKIVLCPSGIESPDNFRLYEALESGCLPIVDAFSTNNQSVGFWRYVLGDDIPFPIVNYWDVLPKLLPELLKGYPANANKCYAWWQLKKREIKYKLLDDVKELSK